MGQCPVPESKPWAEFSRPRESRGPNPVPRNLQLSSTTEPRYNESAPGRIREVWRFLADWRPERTALRARKGEVDRVLRKLLGRNTQEAGIPAGLKHRYSLRGHGGIIFRVAWSPDGRRLASSSKDRTVGIWDVETGKVLHMLKGPWLWANTVAWSPDSKTLAVGSPDATVQLWDAETGRFLEMLHGHHGSVFSLVWSPDGKKLASGSDDNLIRLWDLEKKEPCTTLTGHADVVRALAWSPDGSCLASGSDDRTLRLWNTRTGRSTRTLRGHTAWILDLAWSPDGASIASASLRDTIHIWDVATGRQLGVLEGHTGPVYSVDFSFDGKLLASKSRDGTIRFWHRDTWQLVGILGERATSQAFTSFEFHPRTSALATLGDEDTCIRVWDYDPVQILGSSKVYGAVCYTNAKVVLVGDTGVGKSGIALVLTGRPFQPTESTHGRHVWTFGVENVDVGGGRRETRETLLWDLAGQPGYRLIHQLHLQEVAVALVLFDARSETDPFAGVRHWERALRQGHRLQGDGAMPMKKYLVAARCDRGGVGVSRARIQSVVDDLGFDGFFETSARESWNTAELAEAIRQSINWSSMPRVSSTELFQCIKAFLVEEKEAGVLLSTSRELMNFFMERVVRRESEDSDVSESRSLWSKLVARFMKDGGAAKAPGIYGLELLRQGAGALAEDGDAQQIQNVFETCVGRVESRGLIRRLSFGNLVLLQPEMLDSYASAIVNAARDEPDGMGSIAEEDARTGRFRMSDDERIQNKEQERLLLIATIEDLIRHEIALREQADEGAYLVFPSQFTRENPDMPDPEGKAVIYRFEGPVLNVYATLAVRLSHSGVFTKKEMWKNASTYGASVGGTCGMYLREIQEGLGELTLFFDDAASEETRYQFEEYVKAHLYRRGLPESVQRRRIFVCHECGESITDKQAVRRRERGFRAIRCPVCDCDISLLDREERVAAARTPLISSMDRAADLARDREAGLVSGLAEMRTSTFRDWAGSTKSTLALVFVDAVDSTQLANDMGNEAMTQVRRQLFSQGRDLTQRFDGYAIKTIGDAMMVAFRTSVQALDFSLALLSAAVHPDLELRAGIHIGPVDIEEEDAYGAMVNFTSRVVSMAAGAEIWLSDEAKRHVDQERARRHLSLAWRHHPDCALRGFPEEHSLWCLRMPRPAAQPAAE